MNIEAETIESCPENKSDNSDENRSWFVIFLMSLFFLSFLSPQISYWGRGLKLSIPVFCYLTMIVLLNRKQQVIQIISMNKKYFFSGMVFVFSGFVRYMAHSVSSIRHNFVIACFFCIFLWFVINLLIIQSRKTIQTIRWLCFIVITISVGISIPLLIEQPGIARLTMGNPFASKYIARYFPKGIANYSIYTAIAMSWPVIANWLLNYNYKRILNKWVAWAFLCILSTVVILSTFTMALFMMITGIILWLIIVIFKGKKNSSILSFVIILILLFYYPRIYKVAIAEDPTQFSVSKATRLFNRSLTHGFIEGDETGRVRRIMNTLPTIWNHPFFGAWGLDRRMFIGFHSSWTDFLALFGISGLFLWLYYLSPSLKRGKEWNSISKGIAGGSISWFLVLIGGFLNPTLNRPILFLMIWIFDEKYFLNQSTEKLFSESSSDLGSFQ